MINLIFSLLKTCVDVSIDKFLQTYDFNLDLRPYCDFEYYAIVPILPTKK